MYPYRVLVVDDEDLSREATVVALELYVPRENIYSANCIQAAKSVLSSTAIDLAILDISMQNENGFQMAAYMQECYPTVQYIFLTGYAQFALAGYNYQPLGFLVKPVNAVALGDLLEKVQPAKSRKEKTERRIGVSYSGGFQLLDVDGILYIEKDNRKVIVHFKDDEVTLPKYSLEQLKDVFQDYGFVRVHQSFMVPLHAIEMVVASSYSSSYEIKLKGLDRMIPLSRTKYAAIKELLQENHIRFL